MNQRIARVLAFIYLALALALAGCNAATTDAPPSQYSDPAAHVEVDRSSFSEKEIAYARANEGYETYSELDELGRCGTAMACLGPETMPDRGEERENISEIHPTGWQSIRYDFVEGRSLYNRSHLIAWSLSAENLNERNLVTGTRWMNADAMLPYEEKVASYIDRTSNHVLYRSTPVFEGDELVCRGVMVEAYSLEDSGDGIDFSVWCPNVQPGVEIDYATGEAQIADEDHAAAQDAADDAASNAEGEYVLNTNSRKVHEADCPGVEDIAPANRQDFDGTLAEAENMGYEPCGQCLM